MEKILVMDGLLWKDSVTVIGGDDHLQKTLFAINVAVSVRSGQDFLKRFHVPEPRTVSYTCSSKRAPVVMELFRRNQKTTGVSDLDIPLFTTDVTGEVAVVNVISDLPLPSAMSNTIEVRILDQEFPGAFHPSWTEGFRELARPDAENPDGVAVLVVYPLPGEIPPALHDAAETVLMLTGQEGQR